MREMTRLIIRSRKILIGVAFIGIMSGTGGLVGALVGVVLALLARSVFAINMGTGEFIAAWVLASCLVALLFGTYLTMRELGYLAGRAKVVPIAPAAAPAAESN
jgi:tryptophan-rich sensory protein